MLRVWKQEVTVSICDIKYVFVKEYHCREREEKYSKKVNLFTNYLFYACIESGSTIQIVFEISLIAFLAGAFYKSR